MFPLPAPQEGKQLGRVDQREPRSLTFSFFFFFEQRRFIAGPCRETGGSCPPKLQSPQRVSVKNFYFFIEPFPFIMLI